MRGSFGEVTPAGLSPRRSNLQTFPEAHPDSVAVVISDIFLFCVRCLWKRTGRGSHASPRDSHDVLGGRRHKFGGQRTSPSLQTPT
ncbi:hypothetical protein AVEN_255920-1 [Araneus ventricosus]|uniref:Uncharacterized protein n=1 Tax=Araneus ventricosus TaxID=182803 RepID=A0A4Y2SZH2_ARAVE|nr:hypothetical protein AVEN_255920-1 [Araneus ventricosus]